MTEKPERKSGWRRGKDIPNEEQFGWWQWGERGSHPAGDCIELWGGDEQEMLDLHWYRPVAVETFSDEVIEPLPELPEIVHHLPDWFVYIEMVNDTQWAAYKFESEIGFYLTRCLFELPIWSNWKDSRHVRVDGRFVHHSRVD